MAQLNRDEKLKVDRVDELKQRQRNGELVTDGMIAAAERLAELAVKNAEARERTQQERQAERDAQQAAAQARADARAKAAQDEFLRTARLHYPGTDAEWSRDKDEILRQWQIQQALGADDALVARKRAEYLNRF